MIKRILNNKKRIRHSYGIDPDEIFLDSANVADFDKDQFEGRIERAIGAKTIVIFGLLCLLVGISYSVKVWALQISNGSEYALLSEENKLRHTVVFANRGNIYDRDGVPLAWNISTAESDEHDFNLRQYIEKPGFYNLLGYVKYPQKDKSGVYYDVNFTGYDGVEAFYNQELSGKNGLKIIETNALQDVVSGNTIRPAEHGENITLTIDSRIQEKLYQYISEIVNQVGFYGGGGIITDVHTGEIISLVTYPQFDSNLLTNGQDREAINAMLNDPHDPFLNRVIFGLYTPGSIMKPYVALGALNESVIDASTNIISRGQIEIPNPYDPDNPSIFTDWKAHGSVDARKALAVSSNVYFYVIGGGFKDQEGLGIKRIEEYFRKFGFGEAVTGRLFDGPSGTIPNPEWKEKNFDGDPWRLGDTYFTSIGQYGVQVTPLQVVRALGALVNGGKVMDPILIKGENPRVVNEINDIDEKYFKVVREGMREGVLSGTAKGLDMSEVAIAAKTGTAELGVSKARVNSWVTGFFPYENPKYAFTIVMEKGSRTNFIGGVAVARQLFDWMKIYTPEYFE